MKPINICNNIWYVGAHNPDLRVFDVIMETEYGTSYNAYVVKGSEKIAVIETVKNKFNKQFIEAVSSLIDPAKIDYIVLDHTEPDHSGSISELLAIAPNATVLASRAAIGFVIEQINADFPHKVVKAGGRISLGDKTLSFLSTPFLHWPDSIFTWIAEDKVLFTGDVYGCHYCALEVLDETVDKDLFSAQKYYFDVIMGPFKDYVRKAIAKTKALPVELICPSHGPVLKKHLWDIVDLYDQWSTDITIVNEVKKVVLVYASAYGYTLKLAQTIRHTLQLEGIDVDFIELTSLSPAEIKAKIDVADGFLIGSPTFNRDALPPVWILLSNLSAYRQKKMPAGAFGAYGWSGEASPMMQERMRSLGMKIPVDFMRVKFNPTDEDLENAKDWAKEFAKAVK